MTARLHSLFLSLGAALLVAIASLMVSSPAQANVVCSVTTNSISFGTSQSAASSIGWSCINYNAGAASFTICSTVGNPSFPGTASQPKMQNGGSNLDYNLYTNASYSQVWTGAVRLSAPVSMPTGGGASVTGSLPFYGLIASGQTVPAGNYTANFFNTVLGFVSGGTCQSSLSGFSGTQFTLNVSATVSNACTVTAGTPSNISFGTVASTATNLSATNNITVTCPNGTPYYVGLRPSNGNTAGAGQMSGTGGNTDKINYQLRSTAGSSGTIWGNTATTTSVGNGVARTGTGSAQVLNVYATVANSNQRPDTYSDTVTVTVNY